MSKADYSVVAAATVGIMNLLEGDEKTWSDRYTRLPVLESPSFPGQVILFLCKYGLEFYEACNNASLRHSVLLSESNNRGWTQR